MLTFKTQFPVNTDRTIDDFLECARVWIAGSPHTQLTDRVNESSLQDGTSLTSTNELVTCTVHKDGEREIAGVRYEKREDGEIRWVTDVVCCKTSDLFTVAVQLSVDSELPVERLDQGKRPYILKVLMQHLGGGFDGDLAVTDMPIRLTEHDVSVAADLICARVNYAMPVVYLSSDQSGKTFIDAAQTAKWLSGMAHVVVEPSRAFSFRLMHEVYGENAYGGAVGIYWPDGVGKWTLLPGGKHADPKEMQLAVSRKIRTSLLSQRTKRECTWSHLQELAARRNLQALKDSGSNDIDAYIKHFDTEIAAKNEEIRRLEAELARAKYSRHSSNEAQDANGNDLVVRSTEKDLYQAERLDMAIDALKAAADSAEEHSRRSDVLRDMVEQNANAGERDLILERLKTALRQYTTMTASIRAELESLGFEILDDGKHHKLIYREDPRYPFVLPKTGSDWRGGMNAFSDLRRRIF